MNVGDLMTADPWTVEADASLDEAMALMDRRDLRHLPVVRGDEVVGVVSDRDLLEATGWEPVRLQHAGQPVRAEGRVADVMHAPVATVHPDDTVVTASVELLLRRIGCLPVVSGGGLVGIVTERDLLRAWLEVAEGDDAGAAVDRLMTTDLLTLSPRASLADAVALCRGAGVRHLLVVAEERLVGLVSDRDLKRAVGVHRAEDTPLEEIMTRDVAAAEPGAPLRVVAEIMEERHVSAVPVVAEGRPVGVVTLTDLVTHCMESLRER